MVDCAARGVARPRSGGLRPMPTAATLMTRITWPRSSGNSSAPALVPCTAPAKSAVGTVKSLAAVTLPGTPPSSRSNRSITGGGHPTVDAMWARSTFE